MTLLILNMVLRYTSASRNKEKEETKKGRLFTCTKSGLLRLRLVGGGGGGGTSSCLGVVRLLMIKKWKCPTITFLRKLRLWRIEKSHSDSIASKEER